MHLAEIALAPGTRERLLARNRRLIRDGYARLERWVEASDGLLSICPPAATALGFVRYNLDAPSVEVHSSTGILIPLVSGFWLSSGQQSPGEAAPDVGPGAFVLSFATPLERECAVLKL